MAWWDQEELKPRENRSVRYKMTFPAEYGHTVISMAETLFAENEASLEEISQFINDEVFKLLKERLSGKEKKLDSDVDSIVTLFKYHEKELLVELEEYLKNTYGQHYVGNNSVQSLDLIFSSGNGYGFCLGNIIKYGTRFGKKNGYNRKDLLKIIHYAMLAMYLQDIEEKKETQ